LTVEQNGLTMRPIAGREELDLFSRLPYVMLRSLDAIHLATAVLFDVDVVLTYDERLAMAARHNGLAVSAPS
jgi:hypothetical protein